MLHLLIISSPININPQPTTFTPLFCYDRNIISEFIYGETTNTFFSNTLSIIGFWGIWLRSLARSTYYHPLVSYIFKRHPISVVFNPNDGIFFSYTNIFKNNSNTLSIGIIAVFYEFK